MINASGLIDTNKMDVDTVAWFPVQKRRQKNAENKIWKGANYMREVNLQTDTKCPEPCEDAVSRKAAIDALADMHCKSDEDGYVWIIRSDAWARIDALPSAQPEQRWIPCSERLPEESGRYLVSVLDGVGRRTTVAPYQPRYKAWTMTGRMAYWKVIAWMPLPEPYREGGQDENR